MKVDASYPRLRPPGVPAAAVGHPMDPQWSLEYLHPRQFDCVHRSALVVRQTASLATEPCEQQPAPALGSCHMRMKAKGEVIQIKIKIQ